MPGKKGGDDRVDTGTLKRIWNQVQVKDWLHILRSQFPDKRWTQGTGTIKGKCPFHDDRDPSFVIDLARKHAKCFSSDCGKFFWDPVKFFAEVQSAGGATVPYGKALEELKDRFDIKVSKKVIRAINKKHDHYALKKIIFSVTQGELIDSYTILNSKAAKQEDIDRYAYVRPLLDYWNHRKLPIVFHSVPVGILPSQLDMERLVKNYCATHKIDDVWDKVLEYFGYLLEDASWIGSMLFFTGTSPNDVARIKVRKIPLQIGGTFAPTDAGKDIRFITDDKEYGVGLFGLFGTPPYQPHFFSKDIESFYVVEGEFDALQIMARQFDTGNIGFFAFAGGGNATQNLDFMADFGFKHACLIGDDDSAGDGFVENILKNTLRVAGKVFDWPDCVRDPRSPRGDWDPDEAVKHYGLTVFDHEVREPQNYRLPYQWAMAKAEKEMSALNPEDVRYLTSKAATWGLLVRNKAEQQAYVAELSKKFNIAAGQILDEIKSEDENEEAFIERIKEVLSERLHVLRRVQKGSGYYFLQVFDKRSHEVFDLPISEPARGRAVLEIIFGKDLWKFIREEVGVPPCLQVEEDGKPVYLPQLAKVAGYCAAAIARLGEQLPITSEIEYFSAGLHCVAPNADAPDEKFRLYLVNGTKMYRGDFEDEDHIAWKDLHGPSDGNRVIWVKNGKRPTRFMHAIESAADLNKAPEYTLNELYDVIHAIVHSCWDYKNHDIMSQFLAAQVMALPISACVPRQPLIMFTADHNSGKSNFIGGLIGKTNKPILNIIQGAYFTDNYTAAGVRQNMNHSTLVLCLDEFEDSGGNDRKSTAVRGILHMLRGHANEGGTSAYGTATGEGEEFEFKGPFFGAGIRIPIDPADLSRFILVDMDRKEERDTPETVAMQLFGEEKLQKIRQELPLVMFRHALKYRTAYFDIAREFRDGGGFKYGKLARSREHFYGAMAVMKLCGQDYGAFLRGYFESHEQNLARLAHTSISNDIFSEILSTPQIRLPDMTDSQPRTLHSILSGSKPTQVNDTSSGLYFDKATGWLVVHWATAKTVLLSHMFSNKSATHLKTQVARVPNHISDQYVDAKGVLKRMAPSLGRNISRHEVSVFNVNEFLATEEVKAEYKAVSVESIGNENLDLFTEYKDAIAQKQFPDPPLSKNSKSSGKRKSTEPSVEEDSAPASGPDIDDDFSY